MLKRSFKREAILARLRQRHDHPTAEELYTELKKSIPELSLATVYRNLRLLEDEGSLVRIPSEGSDRFDATVEPHCHFTCTACKRVIDLELREFDINSLPVGFGGEITAHDLMFFGLCPECKKHMDASQ